MEKIIKLAINSRKFFVLIIFILFFYSSTSKSVTNNVIATIDNFIITELDFKKEIEFLKFINKTEIDNKSEKIRRNIIESLIDRKIKSIEVDIAKVEVNNKELDNNYYNYLISYKINDEILDNYYKTHKLENDYLKEIISIDMKWMKMIRQVYESRININLTEVDEQIKNQNINIDDNIKLKNQIILLEKNKILAKFATTHLVKSKKKYLIKFL